jgi:hypothetical protein
MDSELGIYGITLPGLSPVCPIICQEHSEAYGTAARLNITFKSLYVLDEIVSANVLGALISKSEVLTSVVDRPDPRLVLEFYRDLFFVRMEE